jgi:acyl-CoA reductase-like NAD-dependent aldehyde dehydrogenase
VTVRERHHIDGRWSASAGTAVLDVVDPATGTVVGRVAAGDARDVDRAVDAAARAAEDWAGVPAGERAALLRRIATELAGRAEELAATITAEMGSPITFSRQLQAVLPVGHFARAAAVLDEHVAETELGNSLIVSEPIGVVAAITPWNFPLHQVALKVAYALAAGCTVVLKPSEVAPLDAFLLVEAAVAAGLPDGVLNVVTGTGADVGEPLAAHPRVDMVSFTGSTRAGRLVLAAAAPTIKRVALELGGKSANVVLDDADLHAAVRHSVASALMNTGQRCDGLTRTLVPRERLGAAQEIAAAAVAEHHIGDPRDAAVTLGPLASALQRERVSSLIRRGIAEGATVVSGGDVAMDGPGAFVAPTIFAAEPGMAVAREEIFGPVVVLLAHDGEDDAVAIANDTPYGLNNGVWSGDPGRAERVARRLRSGQVEINGADFNPLAPFGGYKQSGLGRESGTHGLAEFLEVKAIQR